ncbi:MAG: FHA domain-containing protein [Bacteroidales bacterium]|nr:FHA domain-containing protein [Bacteroidales bacterium]
MEKITVKLKCPKCGNNLSALVNPGMNIATAQVRCSNSICKYVGKGSEFLLNNNPPKNVVVDNTIPNQDNTEELGTTWYDKSKDIATDMGQIRIISSGKIFPLHFGVNSVGRMAASYKPNMEPDTKIPTNDLKMSRCHARIDVKKSTKYDGYVFHMQDTSLNGIDLNSKEIPKNSIVPLSFGDQMIWGETKVIFEAANGTPIGGDDTLKN